MPDFSDEFLTWVKSVSAITALIGSGTACRCYPEAIKQGVPLPALVYYETGGEDVTDLRGLAGLARTVLNVVAYGTTRSAANTLSETVLVNLCPTNAADITMGTTFCTDVSPSSWRDTGHDGIDEAGSDHYQYWTHRIYDVWHTEAVA